MVSEGIRTFEKIVQAPLIAVLELEISNRHSKSLSLHAYGRYHFCIFVKLLYKGFIWKVPPRYNEIHNLDH